ncbi:Membrane protein insertase YidC 2 [Geodia barretti]|uniref:Membrane protein insertase YidC 2 n=1 Tax=Geodia barretti TaxID=519541 RepID=A0AA35TFI7_GEOBA|nr:Membrane protein insertase YidC 2 [Geodia barretti]
MANCLVLLYIGLFSNFGLSIVVFTVLIRLATMNLTLKQVKSTRAMSTLQPKMKELQAKYKGDRQKLSSETFKLYKEHGVNPIGCLGPLVIQFPIWIGLYWALIRVLPSSPENLVDLSKLLYGWLPVVHSAVPVDSTFLWLDLAVPDTLPIMPLLVGASMWVQQKMMTYPSQDPKQAQTQQMMLWMMPLLFVFLTFSFPSGLALYWLTSNLMGVGIQYVTTVEEAIELALKQLDVRREEAEIEVLSHGKAGIFGFGSEPARVRATLLEEGGLVQSAKAIVDQLLRAMGVSAISTISKPPADSPDTQLIEITGDDSGLLIGRRGETLRPEGRVMLDVEQYRQRRTQVLKGLALRVADRVAGSGRSFTLEPMSPAERRAIHVALTDHPRVMTQSEGEGDDRKLREFVHQEATVTTEFQDGAVHPMVAAAMTVLGVDYEIVPCDPNFADTTEFCQKYGYPMDTSANTIIVASTRGAKATAPASCSRRSVST